MGRRIPPQERLMTATLYHDGALADGLVLLHVALPTHIGAAVAAVNKVASDEMSA